MSERGLFRSKMMPYDATINIQPRECYSKLHIAQTQGGVGIFVFFFSKMRNHRHVERHLCTCMGRASFLFILIYLFKVQWTAGFISLVSAVLSHFKTSSILRRCFMKLSHTSRCFIVSAIAIKHVSVDTVYLGITEY